MHQALNDRLIMPLATDGQPRTAPPETRIEEALALQKTQCSFASRTMPTGELRAYGGKACVAAWSLHLLDAESLRSPSLLILQAIVEFRQKLASEINKLQHAIAEGPVLAKRRRITESEAMAARECNLENICQTLLLLGQMDPNTPPTPATKPPSMVAVVLPIQTICATR